MKIIKNLFIVAFISIAAFSCGSDDDSSGGSAADNQAKIIGTWKLTSSTTNGVTDTDLYICEFEDTYEFNGTSITIMYYEDPSGNNGSNCQLEETYTVNYTIDANNLSSTDEGFTYTQKILTLNNTTLKLEDTETYEGTTYIYTETYTKQ